MNDPADPLYAHLLDILSDPASASLILTGGYGLRLKQICLQESNAATLVASLPEARATQDLDFILRLALFVQKERGIAVRSLLDRLGYQEYTPKWQFGKPFDPSAPGRTVKVDLLARSPLTDETVRVKGSRVGSGEGVDLHGRETPEAFAVEESPILLPLSGMNSRNEPVKTTVYVPHPYAWINMKIAAAYDWLRRERGEMPPKYGGAKHVFDVYIITAMLTEVEIFEAVDIAKRYQAHPLAQSARGWVHELYGSDQAPGVQEVIRQAGSDVDYRLFWQGLQAGLGIS